MKLNIIWIPSHIGIPGNERADRLAAKGTQLIGPNIICTQTHREIKPIVAKFINNMWQEAWTNTDKNEKNDIYHKIVPKVCQPIMKWPNRKAQVIATKLRLNSCRLNHNLYLIGKHKTGLCDKCLLPETVKHFLIECHSQLTTNIKQKCAEKDIPFTLAAILTNQSVLLLISQLTKRRL